MDLKKILMDLTKKEKNILIFVPIAVFVVLVISISGATDETTGNALPIIQKLAMIGFGTIIAIISCIIYIKTKRDKEDSLKKRKESLEKEMYIPIKIKSGTIGLSGNHVMRQRYEDNMVYFDLNESQLYRIVGYEWGGQKNKTVVTEKSTGYSTSTRKGKSGKMTAGAIVGNKILPGGAGAAIGAAIGAGGTTKSYSSNKNNTEREDREVEEDGVATIKMENVTKNIPASIMIVCNSEIDSKIRCFNFDSRTEKEKKDDMKLSIENVKALKELFDMGVITEEEFERKKDELMNL